VRAEFRGFAATPDQEGRRLDRVLRGLYADVPLAAIMRKIRKGEVRVNGRKSEGACRLVSGDVVGVPWGEPEIRRPIPAAASSRGARGIGGLKTLLRDDGVWFVDKPAGLLSQPDKSTNDSVITRAWAELSWDRSDFRPALIHRLDRNVSGVMAIAMNARLLRLLSELMRERGITKTYRAIVEGSPPERGEVNMPLLKDESRNIVKVDQRGRAALTRYRTLWNDGRHALVDLELVTGRPHQARVHMSSIGCPIAGDAKYGGTAAGRLLLHSYSLTFPDIQELPEILRGAVVSCEPPLEFTKINRYINE
jgi:23S rRNA pseudouridine955/2504/2580 synthase